MLAILINVSGLQLGGVSQSLRYNAGRELMGPDG